MEVSSLEETIKEEEEDEDCIQSRDFGEEGETRPVRNIVLHVWPSSVTVSCLSQIRTRIIEMPTATLKEIAIKGLTVLKLAADVASKFFPSVSIVGSLIGTILDVVEKKCVTDLQKDFHVIGQGLDELSKQNQQVMEDIIKATADTQFKRLRWSLKYQYKKYMEMINASPEEVEKRSQEFVKDYEGEQGRQHLYTLYESVVGAPKVFGKPILQVYQQYSGTNRETMTSLSEELFVLFSIGCITMMAHAVLIGDDVEGRKKEWEEKMVEVTSAIQKAVEKFE
ncbi:hypothetical protein OJAV_G00165820 [Oryzias javanicus]|uniref:Rapunzel 2 n=1 Tax=Oryzias javanicus TaxID=123683 RepID=A0A3S2P399_ORYJA|nr:hypothetical protein OJAV_G00165820 [Oryzias javanicus]